MPSYTSLLGLTLPSTGEFSGTWGDVVNQQITQLIEDAVAGTITLSADADVTLTTTQGASNQARTPIIRWTASGSVTRNITAPAASKAYIVINATGGSQSIVIRGVGPTAGVTVPAGTRAFVVWNGSDFATVGSTASGTVTTVSVTSGNGFAGTVSNPTTTPAITLTTTINGMIRGNGTALTAGTANTDFLVPALANTAVSQFRTATFNSQVSATGSTSGAITVDWTQGQNQIQPEPTGTITYTFTAPPGVCHLQLVINSDGTSTAQTINWPGSVIWFGTTWAGVNNKRGIINFWYDGTNYFAQGSNQV